MATRTELVLLQKTLVVVEGVSRALDPGFNMWTTAEPVIRDWIERNLGPVARLEEAGRDIRSLLHAAKQVPALIERSERVIEALQDRGKTPARRSGYAKAIAIALWIIALVHAILLIQGL